MTALNACFVVGQRVRFAAPLNDGEGSERFIILELRGERVLVEFICDMHLRPTFVYRGVDLVRADD